MRIDTLPVCLDVANLYFLLGGFTCIGGYIIFILADIGHDPELNGQCGDDYDSNCYSG